MNDQESSITPEPAERAKAIPHDLQAPTRCR